MGRQNDCVLHPYLLYQMTDLHNLVRVKTICRLIQNNKFWFMDYRLGYSDPLLISTSNHQLLQMGKTIGNQI